MIMNNFDFKKMLKNLFTKDLTLKFVSILIAFFIFLVITK